ncbi:MAG: hypothetical protein ACI4QA_02370 [Candidatus Spyradosoma sp.]
MFRRPISLFCLFAVTLLCAACSYSLGAHGKLPFSTVMVAPIKNMTELTQTQATLATDVADALNAEPGLKTVVYGGNARLEIVVTDVKRSVSLTNSRDTGVASTQTLTVKLSCSLFDVRTGKYYFRDRAVSVSAETYMGGQTGLLETQAFPQLSRDAARKIRDLVVGVW